MIKKTFSKLIHWYFSKGAWPYWCVLILDCAIVYISSLLMYALDHGLEHTAAIIGPLMTTLLFYLIFYIIGFRLMHTYSGVLRFSSFVDLYRVGAATFIGAALIFLGRWLIGMDHWFVPIRTKELIATFLIATALMWALRMMVKYIYDFSLGNRRATPVFIYGVKNGGVALAKTISEEKPQRYVVKGFVSDWNDMAKKMLMGVHVYPNDGNLVEAMKRKGVKTLLVSPLKEDVLHKNTEMVNSLIDADISIMIVRMAEEWAPNMPVKTAQLREVEIEDLLPRNEIHVNLDAVGEMLRDKVIMITGSAGSIGSEMVRQIAEFGPKELILVDAAETPQHDIRLELQKKWPEMEAHTIVTNICRKKRMENIFRKYKPEYVFHAAAYKHVPMMEDNPTESVQNNIDGTRNVADLAVKYGVRKFVMISTDKAVNPTNVMGCSKRICEMYVQSLDKAIKDKKMEGVTQFVTTRFGNVLGSNGSVIPLFRTQIKNGGPITVTHPNIIRFFMLISEACKLVLEAGTMGHGGEIYVFDMGQPVKIADLAKRMIKLSGAEGIEIKYTGLRDGEKLYEEVLNDKEYTKPTFNEKIKIATVRECDYEEVNASIDILLQTCLNFDDMETVKMMKKIVPEYKSQHSKYEVLD